MLVDANLKKLPKLAINFDEKRSSFFLYLDSDFYQACAFDDSDHGSNYQADFVPVWPGVTATIILLGKDLAAHPAIEVFQDAWMTERCKAQLNEFTLTGKFRNERDLMTFTFPWPGKALSPNWSGHWAKKSAAKKAYRSACKAVVDETTTSASSMPPDAALSVLMRFYPPTNRQRDWDNLMASMKSGLDGLADGLGVNDSIFRPRIEVMTELKNCVEIEIEVI